MKTPLFLSLLLLAGPAGAVVTSSYSKAAKDGSRLSTLIKSGALWLKGDIEVEGGISAVLFVYPLDKKRGAGRGHRRWNNQEQSWQTFVKFEDNSTYDKKTYKKDLVVRESNGRTETDLVETSLTLIEYADGTRKEIDAKGDIIDYTYIFPSEETRKVRIKFGEPDPTGGFPHPDFDDFHYGDSTSCEAELRAEASGRMTIPDGDILPVLNVSNDDEDLIVKVDHELIDYFECNSRSATSAVSMKIWQFLRLFDRPLGTRHFEALLSDAQVSAPAVPAPKK